MPIVSYFQGVDPNQEKLESHEHYGTVSADVHHITIYQDTFYLLDSQQQGSDNGGNLSWERFLAVLPVHFH